MEAQSKILIVDDDPDIVESMRIVLENHGYQVISASSAEEGAEKVASERPNLIILDVMMPDGTEGFHFVWKLRQDKDPQLRDLPILVVTAIHGTTKLRLYPDQEDAAYGPGEYLPVQGFVDKPIQPADLVAKVKELLKK
ncbi:MAG: response regulator [Armatimonadota bacterium]